VRRGEIWTLADGRNVLIVSLSGLESTFGVVLAIVLHPSGRYPDTAMSVVIGDPFPCTAVAANIQQLRVARFDGGKCLGTVDPEAMGRVDQALRAVLDL
jgi:mRNA interferase MazF